MPPGSSGFQQDETELTILVRISKRQCHRSKPTLARPPGA